MWHLYVLFPSILFRNPWPSGSAYSIQLKSFSFQLRSQKTSGFPHNSLCSVFLLISYPTLVYTICLSILPFSHICDIAFYFSLISLATSFLSLCFLFTVIVPSHINVGIPLVSSSATVCFFAVFSTLGISNSPMISTILSEQMSLRSMSHAWTIAHGLTHISNLWTSLPVISLAS